MSNRAGFNLWAAVVIFATSSAVVRKLTMIGASATTAGAHNPISYCNVLFAGNLAALGCLLLVNRADWTAAGVRRLTSREWLGLVAVSVVSVALAPSFTFTALDKTTVTNVVLLGRVEPPLLLALGALFLGERVNAWSVAGAIVSLIGVTVTIVLQPMAGGMLMIGRGELYALVGASCLAVGTIVAKRTLGNVPLGIVTVFRTAAGTIVFAAIVLILFPPDHFADVFSPLLWQWMLLYGVIIVAGGQLLWLSGVRASSASQISLASSFSPVVAVLAAYAILSEIPNGAQLAGGALIMAGIAIGQIGTRAVRAEDDATGETPPPDPGVRVGDSRLGFKGI